MESKEKLNQLVKPIAASETATAATNETAQYEIKEIFFNKGYYKTRVIKNSYLTPQNPLNNNIWNEPKIKHDIEVLRSYKTDIAIFYDEYLFLNLYYYNCSNTTTGHLEDYKLTIENLYFNRNRNILKLVYVSDRDFNTMLNAFYSFEQANRLINHLETYINQYKFKKIAIDILDDPDLNITSKLKQLRYKTSLKKESHNVEELKTRLRHIETWTANGIKFNILYSTNKTKKGGTRITSKRKLKIITDSLIAFDNRRSNEKILYDGYDIGISNTKNLKRIEFNKPRCLYYGF